MYKNQVLKFLVTIFLSTSFSIETLAETAFDACYATSQGTDVICVNTRNAEAFRACYATAEGTAEICSRAQ